ncbi:unnamed protein product [Boreogadus saida]
MCRFAERFSRFVYKSCENQAQLSLKPIDSFSVILKAAASLAGSSASKVGRSRGRDRQPRDGGIRCAKDTDHVNKIAVNFKESITQLRSLQYTYDSSSFPHTSTRSDEQ